MTLNEIDSTLKTLRIRHPNLNEAMLTTLLTAGGWDEKSIGEALFSFREPKEKNEKLDKVYLPPLESEPFLIPTADEERLLEKHNPEDVGDKELSEKVVEYAPVVLEKRDETVKEEVLKPEPQSLIEPVLVTRAEFPEPPHNLPLRPFESTGHVWPFSRYKEVFYGEVMPTLSDDEKKVAEKHSTDLHVDEAPLNDKDEMLIFIAGMMLLVIFLLLGYMYSNGRL